MADPIEELLKRHTGRTTRSSRCSRRWSPWPAGTCPAEPEDLRTPEQRRADVQRRASVVPRGPMRGKYTETEKQ